MDLDQQFLGLFIILLKLVFFSMALERGLIVLFEWRWYEKYFSGFGLKVPITVGVAWFISSKLNFDVFAAIMNPPAPKSTELGYFLTAAVMAGGSAGAITLFQGVMRMTKSAQEEMKRPVSKTGTG